MKATTLRLAILGMILFSPMGVDAQVTAELNAYWAGMAQTVEDGDFEGYSRLYHPDAVLVSQGSGTSYAIAQALAGWRQGFVDTREGRARASLTFRFTQRLHDETTAHETGMFRYTLEPDVGTPRIVIIHFEGLLVKKDGAWLMMMEYQKQEATEAEWEAAR